MDPIDRDRHLNRRAVEACNDVIPRLAALGVDIEDETTRETLIAVFSSIFWAGVTAGASEATAGFIEHRQDVTLNLEPPGPDD